MIFILYRDRLRLFAEDMVRVFFHNPDLTEDDKLTYSVIAARYSGKWLFVRHRIRTTYEMPGGHIEAGETPYEAAARELAEETGSVSFRLYTVSGYSVEKDGRTGYGRLFFADVEEIGEIKDTSEIEELILLDSLPGNLTYPDIQPVLFERVIRYIRDLPS